MRDDVDRARQFDTTGGGAGQPSGEGLPSPFSPPSPSRGASGGDDQRPLIQTESITASAEDFEEVQQYAGQSTWPLR